MKTLVYTFYQEGIYEREILQGLDAEKGSYEYRQFPDGESYLRIEDDVKDKDIILLLSLNQPNERLPLLLFFANTMKSLGAKRVGLVAPYLGYMRQDTIFKPGEAVTSRFFAQFVSQYYDWLITVDPHLHRYHALNDIYSMPAFSIHSAPSIAHWIKTHVKNPVIIGPDSESKQWVQEIAELAHAPFDVLSKTRKGDRNIEVTGLQDAHVHNTPVIMDDIISTARTMIGAVELCRQVYENPPICIGVHALFVEDAYQALVKAGAKAVITCNTVFHVTNQIDLSPAMLQVLKKDLAL